MFLKIRKNYKVIIFCILLAFFASFLVYKITLPNAQDLPRQMKNGEMILQGNFDVLTKNVYSYTEPNHPFANHHWLYGVFSFILYKAIGWEGMVVFKIVFLLATFSLLFWTVAKKANFLVVSFFSIPTILVLTSRTALRPEIFSYFFTALFLFLLLYAERNPKSRKIFWLIPLQLVWVNTHLFFGVGILLILGFLFEKLITHRSELRKNRLVKNLIITLVCAVAVTFINPYGLSGAIYSLKVNSSPDFPIASAEINTILNAKHFEPGWSNVSNVLFLPLVGFLLILFVSTLILRAKNKKPLFTDNSIFFFLATIGSAGLAFFIFRAMPLFGLIFLPSAVTFSRELFQVFLHWFKKQEYIIQHLLKSTIVVLIVLIPIICIYIGQTKIMNRSEQGLGVSKYALASANFFKEENLEGPIFNDTDIGSYLIGQLYPKEKVFADNRFGDAYSASFFKDIYLPMIRDEEKWEEGVEKYNFNTIFFYHYDNVDGARDFLFRRVYDPKWAWVYVDPHVVIFVRNVEKNAEVISRFQISSDTILDRLNFLSESDNPEDLLAAADILNLIGAVNYSMPYYMKFLSLKPHVGPVWFVLGKTELMKANQESSNPNLAVLYLERAIQEGWKTWESYSFLALGYLRTGQLSKAREAAYNELRIDPKNEDGKKWIKILDEEEQKLKGKYGE